MAGPRQQYTSASIFLSPNTSELAAKNVPGADRIWFYDQSAGQWQFLSVGANLAISGTTLNATGVAPVGAEYLVKVADAALTAERVVTDTPTITWDWTDATKAKANVVPSTTLVYLATLTQNGAFAPVATTQINTTGATVTCARTSTGLFTATFSTAVLAANKTVILMGSLKGSGTGQTNLVTYERTSTTVVTILCQYQAAGATNSGPFDGDGSTSGLVETTLSVMIYP